MEMYLRFANACVAAAVMVALVWLSDTPLWSVPGAVVVMSVAAALGFYVMQGMMGRRP